jgi:hypothetical protein
LDFGLAPDGSRCLAPALPHEAAPAGQVGDERGLSRPGAAQNYREALVGSSAIPQPREKAFARDVQGRGRRDLEFPPNDTAQKAKSILESTAQR